MDNQLILADAMLASYGLQVAAEDKPALQKTLSEILKAAEMLKKDRLMTDEPASIFRLKPLIR
jgi:hypothetical protein